jgi:hypothetical protein
MGFNRLMRPSSLAVALVTLAGVPTIALASARGPVKRGHYSGTIGPGYPITFHVSSSGKAVTDLVVGFAETCNGAPSDTAPKFHFKTLTISKGKFSGNSTDHFGKTVSDALRISGTISGRKASGKVTDVSRIKSLPTCTQSEPFTAKVK